MKELRNESEDKKPRERAEKGVNTRVRRKEKQEGEKRVREV